MTAVWNEAWLRDYNAKRASDAQSRNAVGISINLVSFTLEKPTPLLNVTIREHWAKRRQRRFNLSNEIATKIGSTSFVPMEKAHLRVIRYSLMIPDHDGMVGGLKDLLDVLQPMSKKHPYGLGFITDDDPAHLTMIIEAVRVSHRVEQRTEVTIERV